jgi:hypothetical protein
MGRIRHGFFVVDLRAIPSRKAKRGRVLSKKEAKRNFTSLEVESDDFDDEVDNQYCCDDSVGGFMEWLKFFRDELGRPKEEGGCCD